VFDTETMAELCVRQGLVDQAIGIFRRLAKVADDAGIRLRYETRISELAQGPSLAPMEIPGLRVTAKDDAVEIEWRLAPETPTPDAPAAATEAPAAPQGSTSEAEIDALIARVMAKLNPEALNAMAQQILKPAVAAILADELKSKK